MPQPSNNNNNSKHAAAAYDSPARPPSPAYDVGYDSSASDGSDSDASPQVEQLLMNHLRFAHAFRKNDAAMILQFLAKDVTLVSVDGARHEGQSAVLAYLVGARMTKLSSNLHVSGCPTLRRVPVYVHLRARHRVQGPAVHGGIGLEAQQRHDRADRAHCAARRQERQDPAGLR